VFFRRQRDNTWSRTHLRFRDLLWLFKPWHQVVFYDCQLIQFPRPAIMDLDWKVLTASGENIEHWWRNHGPGSIQITCYTPMRKPSKVQVSFTDKTTALMCKLAIGGA